MKVPAFLPIFFTLATPLIVFAQTSFVVTEFAGQELTFNAATPTVNRGAPSTLNSLDSFTVTPRGGTTSTTIAHDNYFALAPSGLTSDRLLQFRQTNPQSPLFDTREEYLVAGRQGLSLSTGVNLRTQDDPENWSFQRIFLDNQGVGDGVPDFIAADLAQGQSDDEWRLVDDTGDTVASLTIQSSDWNLLGVHDLSRVITTNDPWTISNFNNRELYGLAIELSDFIVEDTGLNLSSADTALLDQIVNLEVSVPGTGTQPRTDYGFVASNITTIAFVEQVPEPSSMMLLLGSSLYLLFARKRA